MYPLHPLTVHLPLGLLLGNAALTVLYLRRGDRSLEQAAYHCLWLGWLGALLAIGTGTFDAARQLFGSSAVPAGALAWVNAHAAAGLLILVVYWQLWQLRRRNPAILDDPQTRRGYLARLALGVLLLLIDGWLGGHLVYTLRLGVSA